MFTHPDRIGQLNREHHHDMLVQTVSANDTRPAVTCHSRGPDVPRRKKPTFTSRTAVPRISEPRTDPLRTCLTVRRGRRVAGVPLDGAGYVDQLLRGPVWPDVAA